MTLIDFDVVAAADEQGGIGKRGKLPWHSHADLRHFKALTTRLPHGAARGAKNAVIMGRKTWDSLAPSARPLAQRLNVVVTANAKLALPTDVLRVESLHAALQQLAGLRDAGRVAAVFVIGGSQVYAEALSCSLCRRVYLTRVQGRYDCDAYLPPLDASFTRSRSHALEEGGSPPVVFEVYERAEPA